MAISRAATSQQVSKPGNKGGGRRRYKGPSGKNQLRASRTRRRRTT